MENYKEIREKPEFLTPLQVSKVLNVSLSTLKKLIYSGRIKTFKTPGGHHRISREELLKLSKGFGERESWQKQSPFSKSDIIFSLIRDLEIRGLFYKEHAYEVASLSCKIGDRMGIVGQRSSNLYTAALLHDVGLLGISEKIVNKKGILDEQEYSVLKLHPVLSEQMLLSLNYFDEVAAIVIQHHERVDGNGYPVGLAGKDICMEAKIIAVAEAFSSMTNPNSYNPTLNLSQTMEQLKTASGSQFDEKVVQSLI